MSVDLNCCIFTGYVARDPRVEFTKTGTTVCRFTIGVNKRLGNGKGAPTEWPRIVAYGKRADFCFEFLKKGMHVCIRGEYRTVKWKEDGKSRFVIQIVADYVQAAGGVSAGGAPEDAWYASNVEPEEEIEEKETNLPFI